jgi:hypothetical protein
MLGLGNSLSSTSTPYAAITALGDIPDGSVLNSDDENVAILFTLTSVVAEALGWGSLGDNARLPGLTASVTISHTNGEDGVALDPVVNATGIRLYVYKNAAIQNSFYLENTDQATGSGIFSLDITSGPFDGTIDAVGNGNKYNIRINSLSKTGLTDSGNKVFPAGTVINAA